MPSSGSAYTCAQCYFRTIKLSQRQVLRSYHASKSLKTENVRPSIAPKPMIDLRHILKNPELYKRNCIDRNYKAQSAFPERIVSCFEEWQEQRRKSGKLREQRNSLRLQLTRATPEQQDEISEDGKLIREGVLNQAQNLKRQLSHIEPVEASLQAEIDSLALQIPNLTSNETPRGNEPTIVHHINGHPELDPSSLGRSWRSHVNIGSELSLLDFFGATKSTGWGWYYLLNEAAFLEQALIQYALSVASSRGWEMVSPPSIVYSHIANACGFQPRDQNGEQQVYSLFQSAGDASRGKPELSLAATAEIPLAAMKADTTIEEKDLPIKRVALSRCYRAEAGARGADTKGLYRVHEFSKVEMFAWTLPSAPAATEIFDEMLSIQTTILESLDLHCRVLEMPSTDLGASATRKRDIEVFFPSRRERDDGWGEVTSTSICTDYQSRRLATRVRMTSLGGGLRFPFTVNGTAMAVPRVLAAILENGWDEKERVVRIPVVLRPWMGGKEVIRGKIPPRDISTL